MIIFNHLKLICIFVFIVLLYCDCNFSGRSKKTEDSLHYYPPAPSGLPKDEFRHYYRELIHFFDTALLNDQFNGGILIAKNGKIIYETYTGNVDLQKPDSVGPIHAFHIASISKTFTATAILRLVHEGKLSLTDTITRFFPDFPYRGITVLMLLNHRSGLPDYVYFMSRAKWHKGIHGKWNRRFVSNDDVLQMLVSKKPGIYSKPNSKFYYSNTNYVLLALIIEKITGKSYPEYMHQTWFAKLGMNHSYVFTLNDTLKAMRSFTAKGIRCKYDFLDATYGDKNIYATLRDLLKWDQALYSDQLLRPSLLDSAFMPYSFEDTTVHHYGLGWRLQLLPNGKKIIYHFGRWHGFNAALIRLTDEKVTIIILGNKFNRKIYPVANLCCDLFGDYRQRLLMEWQEPNTTKHLKSP